MTEKVVLTKEQAEAIKVIHEQIVNTELGKLTAQEIAKGIVGMYEVEPEFKENDWVVYKLANDERIIGKIIEVKEDFALVEFSEYPTPQYILLSELNHATPSEIAEEKGRRWWKKHRREPWELCVGDILTRKSDGFPFIVSKELDTSNGLIKLNSSEWDFEVIKELCKVASFVKDRLDVKTND